MFASLKSFAYHEPKSLAEALATLADLGPDARVLAGGCDLLPELRRRRSAPSALVNIATMRELHRSSVEPSGALTILPMAALRQVERMSEVRARFSALYDGIASIASVQVKTTGTLVGNLCVATPASDVAPPLMVLGARVRVARRGAEREIELAELFRGAKRHTLAHGELVTEVRVPAPPSGAGSAFAKLTRTACDIAKLNVAALVVLDAGGVCTEARVVLGSVAATPVHAKSAEDLLRGERPTPELVARAAAAAAAGIDPITDLRSTAEYRRRATQVLARRVLERALDRARGAAV